VNEQPQTPERPDTEREPSSQSGGEPEAPVASGAPDAPPTVESEPPTAESAPPRSDSASPPAESAPPTVVSSPPPDEPAALPQGTPAPSPEAPATSPPPPVTSAPPPVSAAPPFAAPTPSDSRAAADGSPPRGLAYERPEALAGVAFAGGFLVAQLLKQLAR
jgi:hypothetical protein